MKDDHLLPAVGRLDVFCHRRKMEAFAGSSVKVRHRRGARGRTPCTENRGREDDGTELADRKGNRGIVRLSNGKYNGKNYEHLFNV